MSLKKWKIISIIGIFLLSFIIHNIYEWFPNTLTSLFAPVNESIWEHNKMIFSAYLIWMFIEKRKYRHSLNNICFNSFISFLFCTLFVLFVFSPIYFYILKTNDNVFITLTIYLIAIILSQIISYVIYEKHLHPNFKKISTILWIFIFTLNAYLTYQPIKEPLFFDYNDMKYGI